MASSLMAAIDEGEYFEVDLLLRVPVDTNPDQWVKPSWPGYQSVFAKAVCLDRNVPYGIRFKIECQFLSLAGAWDIAAVGIKFLGRGVMTAEFQQIARCYPNFPFPVIIEGMATAVL